MLEKLHVGLVFALVGAGNLYAQTTPALSFSSSDVHIADEDGGMATYTVALATEPSGEVTVAVASGDATIATVSPSSLTFTTTNWNTGQTVTLTGVDDDVADPFGRNTTITHTASDGGYGSVSGTVRVTVASDEQVSIRVQDSSVSVLEGGTVEQSVWVTSEPKGDVTISLTNSRPTRVTMSTASLSFTPSNWETKQTVTFSGVNDMVPTGNQIATITLTASGADYDGETHTMTVTFIDNDTPGLLFSPNRIDLSEPNGTDDYTVQLATQPSGEVMVAVASGDVTTATASPSSLTFTTTDWNTGQTVTVTAVDNDIDNRTPRQTTITLTASGADYGSVSGTVPVSVADDTDRVALRIERTTLVMFENGSIEQSVWLNSEPTGNVEISLTNPSPALTMSTTSLSFTPSDWETKQTVTFSGVDNMVRAGNQRVTITFTASGADYDGKARTMTVVVVDDEPIPFTLAEGTSYSYSLSFGIRPDWLPIVLSPTSSAPAVVTVTPTELTWTTVNSGQTRITIPSITMMAVENNELGDGSATISHPINLSPLPAEWIPIPSILVTVRDNDVADPPDPPDPSTPLDPSASPGQDSDPALPPLSSENLAPAFADTAMIGDLVFEVNQAIELLTLPQAIGGNGPLMYGLSGNLPDSLAFDNALRQLSGTPIAETGRAVPMLYRVWDIDADADTLRFTITVTAPDLKPTFGDATIAALVAEVDQAVAWPLPSATGGDGALRYSLSGLPEGLVFNAAMRQVQGAAVATDTTVATYAATDADGDAATLPFAVTILPDLKPTFGDATIADLVAEVGEAIEPVDLPAATGGYGPLTYRLLNLPDGLAFHADTRQLRGAATAIDTTVATYTATDVEGDADTLRFAIAIIDPDMKPIFGDTTLAPLTATACEPIARTLPAAVGGDAPLRYSLSNLPAGLMFHATRRQVQGAATVTDTTVATYAVTDADGDAASLPFAISIRGLDAPAWVQAENYLGADLAGAWDGAILLTWALPSQHAFVEAYRIYREVEITHSPDASGRVVALDEPRDEFIPWARVDAVPGVSVGRTIVQTLDFKATRWAVAAECGGQRACLRVTGDPESGCGVGCPRDAPAWIRAEDYRGADHAGDLRGAVLLTWALPREHAFVEAYHIYREVQITHGPDASGRVVALAEPRDEFIPWVRVDAVPGVSLGSTIVHTLDYRATRWAVAAECAGQRTYLRITSNRAGGTSGAVRAKAAAPQAPVALLPEAFAFVQQGTVPQQNSPAAPVVQSARTVTEGRVGDSDHRAPAAFVLGPNYPNPFNPTTTIQYALPHAAEVQLTIHNVLGQVLHTLVAEYQPAGRYAVQYDGRDLAAGMYFYRLQAGPVTRVGKMILLK